MGSFSEADFPARAWRCRDVLAMFLFTSEVHGAGQPGMEMIRFLEAWKLHIPLLFDRMWSCMLSGSGPLAGHMGGMNH